MPKKQFPYTLLTNEEDLENFYKENKNVEWLGFDTEFIGEKRFHTLLCVIQLSTPNGYYIIDALSIQDFSVITRMLEDPAILKLTHAGENDYRLFFKRFGCIPKNTFDTQIAAGFVGYKYPTSFQKLLDKELKIYVPKGYTVSNWEARPIDKKQIEYALNDVVYLKELYDGLTEKLTVLQRVKWVKEECEKMEQPDFYQIPKHKEALKNSMITSLNPQEQVFLLRLYDWRIEEASRKDYSKEMILPSKMISTIVRNINSGKNALKHDRRLSNSIVKRHWDTFSELFNKKITTEERDVIKNIKPERDIDPQQNTMLEMLYSIVEYICQNRSVAPSLVLHRTQFKMMKADPNFTEPSILMGWRAELLGEDLVKWMVDRKGLIIEMKDGKCILSMKE